MRIAVDSRHVFIGGWSVVVFLADQLFLSCTILSLSRSSTTAFQPALAGSLHIRVFSCVVGAGKPPSLEGHFVVQLIFATALQMYIL